MSGDDVRDDVTRADPLDRLAARLGQLGGVLGVAAGIVEVTVGSSIRPWIGDKNDPVRLGLVTIVLATIALSSAIALTASKGCLGPSRRLAIAAGVLLPALVGFTTVGRLWYLPGASLLAAGSLTAFGLRGDVRVLAQDIDRNATRIFASALAVLYLGLGLAALGTTGLLGVVGALVTLGLLLVHPRVSVPRAVAVLVVATAPFAVATWWSIVTPTVAVLIVAMGSVAIAGLRTPPRHVPGFASPRSSR